MAFYRYGLAVAIALLILSAGAAFSWHTRSSFTRQFREEFRRAKAAGELPPEMQQLDPETVNPAGLGFGMQVSAGQVQRIALADLFSNFWFVWVPLVTGACVGVAALFRHSCPSS